MYEDFRRQVLLELSKVLDGANLIKALGAIDHVAANYTIEDKVQAIVPASKLTEETIHLYLASLSVEGKSKGTVANKFYCLTRF